ncbi:MAG: chorismate synthase [Planctomycetota bacterium]|nr:chorismate synthase [Planctomycetota bacterium]
MATLTYHTAGESHGPALIILIQGMPAGVRLDIDAINAELARRQGGYGRGARQNIETDTIEILSGVRLGKTIASPIALRIANRDSRLDDLARTPPIYRPRPGHADLAGSVKWLTTDCRETLERASARETASRVAAGSVARCLLRELDIEVFGFVRSIYDASTDIAVTPDNWHDARALRDASDVYCPDPAASEKMHAAIRQAKIDKDTVGGLVEAHVFNCPIGLGTCADWRDRLDARLAYAVMGIQAFKSVEIGLGREVAARRGSAVHDPIRYNPARASTPLLGFARDSNNAGGLEGGMTNGMPVVVRGAMKPIATLLQGLPSVNLNTKAPERSEYERSDICAVSAASVVMEAVVAFEIARAALEKFGGDTLLELKQNYAAFLDAARGLPLEPPTSHVIA